MSRIRAAVVRDVSERRRLDSLGRLVGGRITAAASVQLFAPPLTAFGVDLPLLRDPAPSVRSVMNHGRFTA